MSKTLNDGIRKEFKELLLTPEYLEYFKENKEKIDARITVEFFESLLSARSILENNEHAIDDAKFSLLNALRNKFLNQDT